MVERCRAALCWTGVLCCEFECLVFLATFSQFVRPHQKHSLGTYKLSISVCSSKYTAFFSTDSKIGEIPLG